MAKDDIVKYFKDVFDYIGIDVVLLLSVIIIGASLAIIYTGANDGQTADFALIYIILAIVVLGVALASRVVKGTFFHGADYAAIESMSVKQYPVLGLLYIAVFTPIGYLLAQGGALFADIKNHTNSISGPPSFIFQNVFSPVVEEYFYRGFLQPTFQTMILYAMHGKIAGSELIAKAVSTFLAAIVQGAFFALAHLVAFNGSVSQLTGSFLFGFAMGILSSILGILPAIAIHIGYNAGVFASISPIG